jgi:hypothetical protein
MKRIVWIFILAAAAAGGAFAQESNVIYQRSSGVVTAGAVASISASPVVGAPYSGTITNEMVQTLADGTHITQSTTGTVARDSQGRTRQDAPLPMIGNLSAANAPHLVFILDPVAQVSYTLNLTDKTAQKMPAPPFSAPNPAMANEKLLLEMGPQVSVSTGGPMPMPPLAPMPQMPVMSLQKMGISGHEMGISGNDAANTTTEDLGSQTMEGVLVSGARTTRTIPTGQIGNDAPIKIVTEVWTSPDLKTVVYSKRGDPRMGEQTFQLKSIVRAEPDPSLFFVPAGFTINDGPQPIQFIDRIR